MPILWKQGQHTPTTNPTPLWAAATCSSAPRSTVPPAPPVHFNHCQTVHAVDIVELAFYLMTPTNEC